jgi:hypothetical protein
MKAFTFTMGAISTSLITLGALFKIMHWPGTSILIVFGFGIFALLFIPSLAKYWFGKS